MQNKDPSQMLTHMPVLRTRVHSVLYERVSLPSFSQLPLPSQKSGGLLSLQGSQSSAHLSSLAAGAGDVKVSTLALLTPDK